MIPPLPRAVAFLFLLAALAAAGDEVRREPVATRVTALDGDTATDQMIGSYRRRVQEKQDPAGAWRDARRALLEAREGRYAHPFYRAPFLLFGDWR